MTKVGAQRSAQATAKLQLFGRVWYKGRRLFPPLLFFGQDFSGKTHGRESPLKSIANELIEPPQIFFRFRIFFAVLRFLRVGNSLGIPK